MATESSKRVVEVVLKVIDNAGKGIEQTAASLKNLSSEEKKAQQSAKDLGRTHSESAKGVSSAGTAAKKSKDNISQLSSSEAKANAQTQKLGQSAKKAQKDVKDLGDQAQKTGKKVENMGTDMVDSIGTMMADFGTLISIVGSFTVPVVSFASFERAMAEVGAVAQATESQLDRLSKKAMELGSTTEFTASQVAKGMKYLSMAGLSVEQIEQSIGSVLDLAMAGSLDLGQAADIVTNIMTGFGKSASELAKVNDVLVTTFTNTNSTLEELGYALAYVGPIAAGLGADFNDLVAALGLLHNAGLKGTMAGTALRGVLDTLFNPTKDEADQLKVLSDRIGGVGLVLSDVNGDFVGFASLIEQLEASGISAAEALALFGQRAGPGMAALLNQGSAALSDMTEELKNSNGRARELAEKMGDNLVGSFRQLLSAAEGLLIRVGDKLAPMIGEITEDITGLVTSINIWIDANPKLASTIIEVTGAILGMVAAVKALKLLGSFAAIMSPAGFGKTGEKAGSSFAKAFMTKAGQGISVLLPTLTNLFIGGGGWLSTLFTGIGASISGYLTGLGSVLTGSMSAIFMDAGAVGGAAFFSVFIGVIGSAFAGYKFGQLIEPWVSEIELIFTDLNIGELLQSAFAKADSAFAEIEAVFKEAFLIYPKKYLVEMGLYFLKWVRDLSGNISKIPGLSKLLGWAGDVSGINKALDSVIAKTEEMAASIEKERLGLWDKANTSQKVNAQVIEGINQEAAARQKAYEKEKEIAAKKAVMYKEIEAINKEFDPSLEKAQKELDAYEKKFYNLQGVARVTADSLRSSLEAAGKDINRIVARAFDDIDMDPAIQKLSRDLDKLNWDYETSAKDLAKKMRQVENDLGIARIDATKRAVDKSVSLIEEQAARRIAVEKAAAIRLAKNDVGRLREEEKLGRKLTAIYAETAESKKKVYLKAQASIQKELQRSLASEEQLANKLKSLIGYLDDAVSSINSSQRDLERELMDPAEAYRDQLKEVKEVLAEGDQLAAAGDIQAAVEKWREAANLAKATAKEVKDGDMVIVSKTEATQRALSDMEEAEQRIAKAGAVAVNQTARQLDEQKKYTDRVKRDLEDINTKLVDLNRLTSEGLKVKVTVDLRGFERDIANLTKTQTAIVKVSAQIDEAQEAVNQAALAKTEALQTRIKDKYKELADGSKEYQQSVKAAAIAVNQEAEQSTRKMGAVKGAVDSLSASEKARLQNLQKAAGVSNDAYMKEKASYDRRISLSEQFARKIKKVNEDIYDAERERRAEESRHKRFLDRLEKAEETYQSRVEKIWKDAAKKKEKIEEDLSDFLEKQNKERQADEADTATKKADIEADAADKIRKIRQRDMTERQKDADNHKAYYQKIKEGTKLVEEGYRKNDQALIERGKTLISQAQGIAEGFNKERDAINGVKKTAEELKKAEDYEAKLKELKRQEEAQKKINEAKLQEKQIEEQAKKSVSKEKDTYQAQLDALATQQKLQKGYYEELKKWEAERHQTEIDNINAEIEEYKKKLALFQQAKTYADKGQISTPDSPATGDMAGPIKEQAKEAQLEIKKIGDTWTQVISQMGNDSAAASESIKQPITAAKNGYEELIVATTESGKTFVTTASTMATGFSAFGNVVRTESLSAVKELNTAVKETGSEPVDIQISTNAEEVKTELSTLKQDVSEEKTEVTVDADTTEAETAIKSLPDSVPDSIPVAITADGIEEVKGQVQALSEESVTVPATLTINSEDPAKAVSAVKAELNGIGETEPVVAVTVDRKDFDKLLKDLKGVEGTDITVTVSVSGMDDVKALVTWIEKVEDKKVAVKADVTGDDDVVSLSQVIDGLVNKTIKIIASVSGLDKAYELRNVVNELHDKTITITTRYKSIGKKPTDGYATGGEVFRRLSNRYISSGSGTKDDVPAMLMKGEYVHRVAAVEKYGKRFMDLVNSGQFPVSLARAFAVGGPVDDSPAESGLISYFATGGEAVSTLLNSLRKRLFELVGGDVSLNVGNLNINNAIEQRAANITSEIGQGSIAQMAETFNNAVSQLASGGSLDSAALFNSERQKIENDYKKAVSEAKIQGKEEVAKILQQEKEELLAISKELQETLDTLKIEYEEAVTKRKADYEERVAELKEEYQKEVSDENESYSRDRSDLDTDYKREKEDYEKAVAEETAEYKKSISEIDTSSGTTEEELRLLMETKRQEYLEVAKKAYEKYKDAEFKRAWAASKKWINENTFYDKGNPQPYYISFENFIQDGKFSEAKEAIKKASWSDGKYGSWSKEFADKLLGEITEYESKALEIKKELGEAGIDAKSLFTGRLDIDSYASQVASRVASEKKNEVDSEYFSRIAELTSDWKRYQEDFDVTSSRLDEDHNKTLAELKEDYEKAVASEDKALNEDLTEYSKTYEENKTASEENAKERTESVKQQSEEAVAQANEALAQKLEELKNSFDASVESLKAESTTTAPAASSSVSASTATVSQAVDTFKALSIEDLLKRLGRGILHYNEGGIVPFISGSIPGKDSVLAALTPGEAVVKAPVVSALGASFFESLNGLRFPDISHFTTGGIVDDSISSVGNYTLTFQLNGKTMEPLTGTKTGIESLIQELEFAKLRG